MNRAQRRQHKAANRNDPLFLKHQAVAEMEAGRLDEALKICQQGLNRQPRDGDLLHLMGALKLQQKQAMAAIPFLEQGMQANADGLTCGMNLAKAYAGTGQLGQAIRVLQDVLRNHRKIEVCLLLADYASRAGQPADVLQACETGLRLALGHADLLNYQLLAHVAQQDLEKAERLAQQGTLEHPGHPDLVENSCRLAELRNDAVTIEAILRRAITANPTNLRLATLWIGFWCSQNQIETAIQQAERLLPGIKQVAPLCFKIANTLRAAGDYPRAQEWFRRTLAQDTLNGGYWNDYIDMLEDFPPKRMDPQLERELTIFFSLEDANHLRGAKTVYRTIASLPELATFVESAKKGRVLEVIQDTQHSWLMSSPLVIQMLQTIPNVMVDLEVVLTALRREWLLQDGPIAVDPSFLVALAHQAFLNEYVWCVTDQEQAALAALKAKLERAKQPDLLQLALYGSCAPLYTLENAARLAKVPCSESFTLLFQRQLHQPLLERSLRQSTPRITPIADMVSTKVRSQYEENPYPRWDNWPSRTSRPFRAMFGERFPWMLPDITDISHPAVLVAGCGTGRHAFQTHLTYTGAETLAVDLSLSSLSYARRKQIERNVSGLTFAQADILQLGKLNRTFDLIESSGVLHHMDDPLAGWQILTDLLKPGGFMQIALYSELARRHIVQYRKQVQQQGIGSDADSIRQWRQQVIQQPPTDSSRDIAGFMDFFTLSMCRDLVFHVQEHLFTVPRIRSSLETLGLDFLGFEFPTHQKCHDQYRARFPEDKTMANLNNWAVFEQENPDTFRSMYQFWCRKPA